MNTIKIMNDFLHSPIRTYEDGIVTDDYPIISEDEVLRPLSEKADNEINNGSFTIEDYVTERLKQL